MYLAITYREQRIRDPKDHTQYTTQQRRYVVPIRTDAELDMYLSRGYDIVRRDNSGDTLIATGGKWLEPKPNIENTGEFVPAVPSDISAQITQTAADVAYLSMMTGVSL